LNRYKNYEIKFSQEFKNNQRNVENEIIRNILLGKMISIFDTFDAKSFEMYYPDDRFLILDEKLSLSYISFGIEKTIF
jgi:hypothetical protein